MTDHEEAASCLQVNRSRENVDNSGDSGDKRWGLWTTLRKINAIPGKNFAAVADRFNPVRGLSQGSAGTELVAIVVMWIGCPHPLPPKTRVVAGVLGCYPDLPHHDYNNCFSLLITL
jgi:hypothetical protein